MNWDLIVDSFVRKRLERIPKRDAERLFTAIRELVINPYAGDIEKMEGEESTWRRRIGAYRIIYEIRAAKRLICVSDLQRRTSSTY